MNSFLSKTERTNTLGSLGVLVIGYLLMGWGFMLVSLFAGLAVGVMNLRMVAFLGTRIVAAAKTGQGKGGYAGLLGAKLLLLILVCSLMVLVFKVEPIPFLVGISVVYAVLMFESFRFMGQPAEAINEGTGEG